MKLGITVFLCVIFSILFIVFAIFMKADSIYAEQLNKVRLAKIQKVCVKKYLRQKKLYIPIRSVTLAQNEINKLLKTGSELKTKKLNQIVNIVNHVKEDVVLSISIYTDAEGSSKDNLASSQKRADSLKAYFLKRTDLLLIVAIGYGEALAKDNKQIKINLRRVKKG